MLYGLIIWVLLVFAIVLIAMLPVYLVVLAVNYVMEQAHVAFQLPTNFLSIFCIAFVLAFVVNLFKRKAK